MRYDLAIRVPWDERRLLPCLAPTDECRVTDVRQVPTGRTLPERREFAAAALTCPRDGTLGRAR